MNVPKDKTILLDQTRFFNNGKKSYFIYETGKNFKQKTIDHKFNNTKRNKFTELPKKNMKTYLLSETNSIITHYNEYNLNLGNVKDLNNSKFNSILKKNENIVNKKKRINSPKKNENSNIKSILKNKNLSSSCVKKHKAQKSVRFNFTDKKKKLKEIKENFPLKLSKNISLNIPKNITEKFNIGGLSDNSRKISDIIPSQKIFTQISSKKVFKNRPLEKIFSKKLVVKFKGRSREKKSKTSYFKMNDNEKKLYEELKRELDKIENSMNIKKKLINQKIERIEDIRFKLYK